MCQALSGHRVLVANKTDRNSGLMESGAGGHWELGEGSASGMSNGLGRNPGGVTGPAIPGPGAPIGQDQKYPFGD